MKIDHFAALRVPGVPTTVDTIGDGGNPHKHSVSPVFPVFPPENGEAEDSRAFATPESETPRGFSQRSQDSQQTGETPCAACGCGSFWRGESGAWRCEQCTPPGNAKVPTWRNVGGGKAPQAPRPAVAWPADLDALLARVSCAFEWSTNDVRDFRQWARRSSEGLADARVFLEGECAKLPTPGLDARRRVVVDMLERDPALRLAWLCEDDGADPVRLVVAVRGAGCCEMSIPRAKFNALALPDLIGQLTTQEDAS